MPRHKGPDLPQRLLVALPRNDAAAALLVAGEGVELVVVVKLLVARGVGPVLVGVVPVLVVVGDLVLGVVGPVVVLGYEGCPNVLVTRPIHIK